jgi:RNA polymerase sigma-70 factor (ECF subfamily)
MDPNNISKINDLYNKYNLDIRAIVAKILYYSNQEYDIDDCVNDVYLRLIENLQKYNETRGSMAAFVVIIARSTALNYCKGNIHKPNELIGDEKIDVLSDPINVEDEIEFKILIENITKKLKREERILFTMRYIYYFTPEEIAKEFNINLGTSYKRITRLKDKIKKLLLKGGITL